MTCEAISRLHQRMIEDMTIRQFGGKTQSDYVRQMREFAVFFGRSPDRAEPEDLRRYLLHLASWGASYASMNLAGTALWFFFHTTLDRAGFRCMSRRNLRVAGREAVHRIAIFVHRSAATFPAARRRV